MERELDHNNPLPYLQAWQSVYAFSFNDENVRHRLINHLRQNGKHHIEFSDGIHVPSGIDPETLDDLGNTVLQHPVHHFLLDPSQGTGSVEGQAEVHLTLSNIEEELGVHESIDQALSAKIVTESVGIMLDSFSQQVYYPQAGRLNHFAETYSEAELTDNLYQLFKENVDYIPEELLSHTMVEINKQHSSRGRIKNALLGGLNRLRGGLNQKVYMPERMSVDTAEGNNNVRSILKNAILEAVRVSASINRPEVTKNLIESIYYYARTCRTVRKDELDKAFNERKVTQKFSGYTAEGVLIQGEFSRTGFLFWSDEEYIRQRFNYERTENCDLPSVYWLTQFNTGPRLRFSVNGGFKLPEASKRVINRLFGVIDTHPSRWN